jgi:hypothetical protein
LGGPLERADDYFRAWSVDKPYKAAIAALVAGGSAAYSARAAAAAAFTAELHARLGHDVAAEEEHGRLSAEKRLHNMTYFYCMLEVHESYGGVVVVVTSRSDARSATPTPTAHTRGGGAKMTQHVFVSHGDEM